MADPESADTDDSDVSSDDNSSAPATELMITTRERRRTAGNRYSQVVAQEQADEDAEDDVALLFAEAEGEDEEYNSDEADDEADMSSSDDDDQGPNAGGDEFEGEADIQKQAKTERQKKRKADMALTTMNAIRKKPKIDPTSLHRAPDKPKPSKRKERVSWLPNSDAAPGRTSLRKQTVAHRETMMERLKENEEVRLRNKAQREKKERLKQAEAPRELTQTDRLAEAARNERRNAKSLNRWEAKEKERAEEQAARLAALKERKLEGAVITSYSVQHTYQGLKNDRVSPGPMGEDEIPAKRKYQRRLKPPLEATVPTVPTPKGEVIQPVADKSEIPTIGPQLQPKPQASLPLALGLETGFSGNKSAPKETQNTSGWLEGIHEYATLPSAPESQNLQTTQPHDVGANITNTNETTDGPLTNEKKPQEALIEPSDQVEDSQKPPIVTTEPSVNTAQDPIVPQAPKSDVMPESVEQQPTERAGESLQNGTKNGADSGPRLSSESNAPLNMKEGSDTGKAMQEPSPVIEVVSTRNLVVLDRFDELSTDERRGYSIFYNTKKVGRLHKTATEQCAMTGQVAKYRDPTTGVGYSNLAAYKKLKDTQKHKFGWSSMLGCYVGRASHAARGVPDGFAG